jgi:DNA-binding transcriptional MerR regulator
MGILGELLTTQEAAKRAGRHRDTIRRWVNAGLLAPVDKLPGQTGTNLYHPADVDRARAAADEAKR